MTSRIDRRSGRERRTVQRQSANIRIEWEGRGPRKEGVIADISTAGCFVLCSGDVEDGDAVKMFLPVGEGMKVEFSGEVVNHVYEIGFAARFVDPTPVQQDIIEMFLKSQI